MGMGSEAVQNNVPPMSVASMLLWFALFIGSEQSMIKVLMERDMPPAFDAGDEAQASRHARIALEAVTATAGFAPTPPTIESCSALSWSRAKM